MAKEEYSLMFEIFILNFDDIFEELYLKIERKYLQSSYEFHL